MTVIRPLLTGDGLCPHTQYPRSPQNIVFQWPLALRAWPRSGFAKAVEASAPPCCPSPPNPRKVALNFPLAATRLSLDLVRLYSPSLPSLSTRDMWVVKGTRRGLATRREHRTPCMGARLFLGMERGATRSVNIAIEREPDRKAACPEAGAGEGGIVADFLAFAGNYRGGNGFGEPRRLH